MAGAWQRGLSFANAQSLSPVYPGSSGILVYSGGSAYTKGSWTTIVASNPTNSAWLSLNVVTIFNSGSNNFSLDIGVGASGSEVALISNMLTSSYQLPVGSAIVIPLEIKSGTRISARVSCENASDFCLLQVLSFSDTFQSTPVPKSYNTFGFNSAANIGVAVDSGGTANTKGAYTVITSSITNSIAGFFLAFDVQNNAGSVGIVYHLVDIAVGAPGSEIIIIPDYQHTTYYYSGSSSGNIMPVFSPYFPIAIKAGTAISVRCASSATTTPDRYLGVTLYGGRQ